MNHEASAEPNLTPMLDLVFQLITFFMLVFNFKAASLDLNLKLPVIGSAKPVENKGREELLILNITSTGKLNVYGQEQSNVEGFIATEAQKSLLRAKRNHPNIKSGDDLPSQVVIRADKTTPFALLNKVIKSCQTNGYRNFSLKALNKAAEK